MRPHVEQQITSIGETIKIESLQVEDTESILRLIKVLEEKIFVKNVKDFVPALNLNVNVKKGIGKAEVARDRKKIELFEKIIHNAIDKVEKLIETADLANLFNKKLDENFPKKKDNTSEVIDKLTQLLSILQSYLDLFEELENGSGNEISLNFEEASEEIATIEKELNEILIGQEEAVRLVLIALFTGGHVLLESSSGLGKTKLAKSLGDILGLRFARIQCTPDLMASDIVGYYNNGLDGSYIFKKGPIFANVVLADEINRATPKTQSALLEAMEEKQATNGRTRSLPKISFVIATQNSASSVGTFPLPEAQLDRFSFVVDMDLPDQAALAKIIGATLVGDNNKKHRNLTDFETVMAIQETIGRVAVPSKVIEYINKILYNTHPKKSDIPNVRKYVQIGSTIRGNQAIIRGAKAHALLDGRTTVSIEDVKVFIRPALLHRISLSLDGMANPDVSVDTIIDEIIAKTTVD